MNEVNVPNAINILNRLKEKLKELHIPYKASANTLTIISDDDNDDDDDESNSKSTVNVPEMVRELIQESLT
jgi:hypothetical protein